jgi:hypothetical protein
VTVGEEPIGQVLEVAKLEEGHLLAFEHGKDARLHPDVIRPQRRGLVRIA